ncbi:6-carboxytetrahydropterin synthase [Pseudobacteriovorax antillogorgiicola]|uniref:6-carboxy-5,6,7,8-tetrahydropterin synthase n=1 Tax=Pseudobacteriovorax antillogorgiicola TaxID=1513793 RepID=A0A1Y6B328_9BACT|nr:6-carboxytetrahydropterin synthase [Pseudobacteriovorax antillogorgiicola]TCS59558.1 6-pyruvoyl tetrahydropterin synthase-like protein [Pseudobacteriovorax antillogorgiicola]SME87723.1 6-pyruvoyl tetrahydropterin synthase [Pseudobacteriovorax antillogorgiicola]
MDNTFSQTVNREPVGTLFIKDVDRIDCATFDPSVGVTGKSWYVDVEVGGALDDNGFVYDFSLLKKLVKKILKETVDHALLIPIKSSSVEFESAGDNERWTLSAKTKLIGNNSTWTYECPKGSVYPVRSLKITRNIIEQECTKLVRHRLPNTIQKVAVKLRKEEGDAHSTFFRYTHGITGHEGLCQRLFHGHRSRVEVFVADERRTDLERYVAHDLFGSIVHIASVDQVTSGVYEPGMRMNRDESVSLAYTGSLGTYKAEIPLSRTFFVKSFTSIESITTEVAMHLKERFHIQAPVRVHCYEGIDKGAITEV